MALPRRLYLVVPVTGVAVAVAFAVIMLTRDERASDDTREAPAGVSLLFAEFGTNGDRVFRAQASDPSERALVATIPHAPEWGINPAAQAAGDLIAYTVLPPSAPPERETPAELRVLDAASGETRLLASDADLLTAPVVDREGTHVAYRSNRALGVQALVSVDLTTGARRTLYEVETAFGVYPVGFDSDGRLLFASLSRAGTELYRAGASGGVELVVHASDEVARDWQLSPDGRRVTFVAPTTENERIVQRVHVVDLVTRAPLPVGSEPASTATVQEYGPVWRPDGTGITVGREPYPDARAAAVTYPLGDGTPEALAAPERGYDIPVSWSADGAYLAVRSFDGVSAQAPGDETLVVVARDGERRAVVAANELLFLGWVRGDG